MRGVRPAVVVGAIALALLAIGACEAKLDGAPCPCIEPEYTCVESVCRRALGSDAGAEVDAAPVPPDAGFFPDGGFIPDSGFLPDAEPELRAAD